MAGDPRDVTPTNVGSPLRDAAVDPEPTDYLPPTNAGADGELGNPHGPHVVAPGIHAEQGIRPVRPGAVSDDPATQSQDETAHLVEHVPEAATPAPVEPDPDTGA